MTGTRARLRLAPVILLGLLVAFALAAFVSPFASSQPDGLNKVAAEHRFDGTARGSATADSPLADYAVENVANEKVTKGFAGIIGVMITLLAATAVFGVLWHRVRRVSGRSAEPVSGT